MLSNDNKSNINIYNNPKNSLVRRNNFSPNKYYDDICQEEYERLEKIDKLEIVITDLKIKKFIYRNNFEYFTNVIRAKIKNKINLIKIYTFLLRKVFKTFIASLKIKICSSYLKKFSFTYLYSTTIGNFILKLKQFILDRRKYKLISGFKQKIFNRRHVKTFCYNFNFSNDLQKQSVLRIKNFLENILDLKNNLPNYAKFNKNFMSYLDNYNKKNIDDSLYEVLEIDNQAPQNMNNEYNFSLMLEHIRFSDLNNVNNFKNKKILILKKILFEALWYNSKVNYKHVNTLQNQYNSYLKFKLFATIKDITNWKQILWDKQSEYNLIQKHSNLKFFLKYLIEFAKIKRKSIDLLIKMIKSKKMSHLKYFFFFLKRRCRKKYLLKERNKLCNELYYKKVLAIKLLIIKNKLNKKKNDLKLVRSVNQKKAFNMIRGIYLGVKKYKENSKNLFFAAEKIFMRRCFYLIRAYPLILKAKKRDCNKRLFYKLLCFKIQKIEEFKNKKFYFKAMFIDSEFIKCVKKHNISAFIKKTKQKNKQKKNQRMAYFYHDRKSKIKIFKALNDMFDFLKKEKEKYIISLLCFRQNYVRKAFNGFKINLMVCKQKKNIYNNLMNERNLCIKYSLLNKILTRVSLSLALNKDAFQNRYFEIIKKLKSEKFNFDKVINQFPNINYKKDNNFINNIDVSQGQNLFLNKTNIAKIVHHPLKRMGQLEDRNLNPDIFIERSNYYNISPDSFSPRCGTDNNVINFVSTKKQNYLDHSAKSIQLRINNNICDKKNFKTNDEFSKINIIPEKNFSAETTSLEKNKNMFYKEEKVFNKSIGLDPNFMINPHKMRSMENIERSINLSSKQDILVKGKGSKINEDINLILQVRNKKRSEPITNA